MADESYLPQAGIRSFWGRFLGVRLVEIIALLTGGFTTAYRHKVIHIGKALNVVVGDMITALENTLTEESGK